MLVVTAFMNTMHKLALTALRCDALRVALELLGRVTSSSVRCSTHFWSATLTLNAFLIYSAEYR